MKLGCKTFIISGAFGDRLDHTLATMSITEKIIKQNESINIILTNSKSIFCPLRSGFKHKLLISKKDFYPVGCGLVSFQKVEEVETSGFRWNLGKGKGFEGVEWGRFLSTSN